MSSRALIVGFEPFDGEKVNPSEVLLEFIKKDFSLLPPELQLDTCLLPVSFSRCFSVLLKKLALHEYRQIIFLGQAGGRFQVSLERVALNWIQTQKPDEDGFFPKIGPIEPHLSPALFTRAPIDLWYENIKNRNIPVNVSLSAGGYVCNYIFFKTLNHFLGSSMTQVAFVHLPYLPEQVIDKPAGTACMELTSMREALLAILNSYRDT